MSMTSWATAMLDTVALPMWLSGIKNSEETLLSTPIWSRTLRRSGLVAGSISQITSKAPVPIARSYWEVFFDLLICTPGISRRGVKDSRS